VESAFHRQLFAGLAALLGLIAAIAIVGIVMLHRTSTQEAAIARDYADGFSHVQQLPYREERLVAVARGYLLSGEPALRARFDAAAGELEAALAELEHHELPPAAMIDRAIVNATARRYLGAMKAAVERRATLERPADIVPVFDRTLDPLRAELETAVDSLARGERESFDRMLLAAQRRSARTELFLVLLSLLAIGSGLLLATIVSRRLAGQFRQLEDARAAATRSANAREEVLAVVSHDLRNPLQAIAMGAELVASVTHEDVTRRHVATIHNAADRMEHMIDELLEASRLERGKIELELQPADAAELVDAASDLFRERARDGGIDLAAEAPHVEVLADRERVLEVLSNLIGNALKFVTKRGHIAVRAESFGDDVRFSVEDDGPGIAAGQLPHVFERGWQGKHAGKHDGLGLGLYICKRLVEAQHGTIGVASDLGKGTTVWFTLPTPVTG